MSQEFASAGVTLGVFDLIHAKGPLTEQEIAKAINAPERSTGMESLFFINKKP